MNKGLKYIIGIIIVLAVIYVVVEATTRAPVVSTTTVPSTVSAFLPSTYIVQLTDPPQVPVGTSALVVTYSNVELHEAGQGNTSGFISTNASGTVNLMNLTNFTQTIAALHVSSNQTFDMARFNITSASITINGTTYNVTVPSSELLVKISGTNSTSRGAVIDLTPTIVEIYEQNQTLFVLVPSVRAVAIGSSAVNSSSVHAGFRVRVNSTTKARLDSIRPNISIVSESLSIAGNRTDLSVTVKNNANRTVQLKHVILEGYTSFSFGANASVPMTAPGYGGLGAYGNAGTGNGMNYSSGSSGTGLTNFSQVSKEMLGGNLSEVFNISSNDSAKGLNEASAFFHEKVNGSELLHIQNNLRNKMNYSVFEDFHSFNMSNMSLLHVVGNVNEFYRRFHNVLTFIVMSNGTLSLPFAENEAEGPNGYNLTAGSEVTLAYNSVALLGEGHPIASYFGKGPFIVPLVNQTYTIKVIGTEGAYAQANVTAS